VAFILCAWYRLRFTHVSYAEGSRLKISFQKIICIDKKTLQQENILSGIILILIQKNLLAIEKNHWYILRIISNIN
jgi:hypothetical protein